MNKTEYEVNAKIDLGGTDNIADYHLIVVFTQDESDYGNGYYMTINEMPEYSDEYYFDLHYDLRYSVVFDSSYKMSSITKWAEYYWRFQKIKSISIKKLGD